MPFQVDINYARQCIPDLNIVRELNRSGQKAAFEAYRDSEHLALKIYNPQSMPRIDRELGAMFKVDSPYIIKLQEFYVKVTREFQIIYSLEEFIEGEELGDRLGRGYIYNAPEAIHLLDQLLQGLDACAKKSIVHRDIKPGNIMLRTDGTPIIIDFGIARDTELESLTPTELVIGPGTIEFSAPEVLENRKNLISVKSDLFSLGITTYMMLTGKHPFLTLREPRDERRDKMLTCRATPPHQVNPAIPQKLSGFVMTLIEKQLIDRFRDAEHALEHLRRISIG